MKTQDILSWHVMPLKCRFALYKLLVIILFHIILKMRSRSYFFTPSQIDKVQLSGKFLISLSVFLLDVDEKDAVTPGAVLIHV